MLTFVATIFIPPALTATQLTPAGIAYTPRVSTCPLGTTLVRSAGVSHQTLSHGEKAYVSSRRTKVLPAAWSAYYSTVEQSAANQRAVLPEYVREVLCSVENTPTLGIAASGGGYRAAFFDAGILNALDGRNTTSIAAGTGGLLQATSYITGLSAGAWLLTSLAQAGFPTIPSLIFGLDSSNTSNSFGGFLTQFGLFEASDGSNATEDNAYVKTLLGEVAGKAATGLHVTITDFWARGLSRHFVNGTNATNFLDPNITHGAGETFSSLIDL